MERGAGRGPDRRLLLGGALALAACGRVDAGPGSASAPAAPPPQDSTEAARFARLVASYPEHLAGIEGDALVWTDGTRMPLGAGQPARPFATMLRDATLADQLRQAYEPGPLRAPPPPDHSPGRLRHTGFFLKMYGDCRRGETARRLTTVTWMPRTRPQPLQVTTVNDVAARLARVIARLEDLPEAMKAFLVPAAGTFNCRAVADTGLPSMHASGAAIDIAVRSSDYWVWSGAGGGPRRPPIPQPIVDAFEAERFIWGGKWYHFDTMHFEYRPELFA